MGTAHCYGVICTMCRRSDVTEGNTEAEARQIWKSLWFTETVGSSWESAARTRVGQRWWRDQTRCPLGQKRLLSRDGSPAWREAGSILQGEGEDGQ